MVDTRSDRSLSIAYWCLAAAVGGASGCGSVDAQATDRASITIDAGSVQGPISPLLHGRFLEFMFEGVKSGLTAEMNSRSRVRGGPQCHRPAARLESVSGRSQRRLWAGLPLGCRCRVCRGDRPLRGGPDAARLARRRWRGRRRVARNLPIPVAHPIRCHLSRWLKTTGYAGPVTIALEEPTGGGGVGGLLQRAGHLTLWHDVRGERPAAAPARRTRAARSGAACENPRSCRGPGRCRQPARDETPRPRPTVGASCGTRTRRHSTHTRAASSSSPGGMADTRARPPRTRS